MTTENKFIAAGVATLFAGVITIVASMNTNFEKAGIIIGSLILVACALTWFVYIKKYVLCLALLLSTGVCFSQKINDIKFTGNYTTDTAMMGTMFRYFYTVFDWQYKQILSFRANDTKHDAQIAGLNSLDSFLLTRSLGIDTTSMIITADKRIAVNPGIFAGVNGRLSTHDDLLRSYYQVDSLLNVKITNIDERLKKNNSPTRDEFNTEKSFLDKLRSGSTSVQIKPL